MDGTAPLELGQPLRAPDDAADNFALDVSFSKLLDPITMRSQAWAPSKGVQMRFGLASVVAAAVFAAAAPAQTPSAMSSVLPGPQTTPGGVSRITLYRTKTGKTDAFWSDVRTHLVPIYEEYKKQGLVTNYGWFTKSTLENQQDWDVGFSATFANWSALDKFNAAATDPITLAHYGSAANRTAAGAVRSDNRDVVSSFLIRAQAPNPMPKR